MLHKRGSRAGLRGNLLRPSRESMPTGTETDDRPAALKRMNPLRPARPVDSILLAESQAKYLSCADIAETAEEHIIPRKSLTIQQHLGLFPQTFETEAQQSRQRDKRDGKLISTSDQRVVWKSDKTLLRRGSPESQIGHFKRETSKSKHRIYQPEHYKQQFEIPVTPSDI